MLGVLGMNDLVTERNMSSAQPRRDRRALRTTGEETQ